MVERIRLWAPDRSRSMAKSPSRRTWIVEYARPFRWLFVSSNSDFYNPKIVKMLPPRSQETHRGDPRQDKAESD